MRLDELAFLHDFGKANQKFQRGEGGHIHEAPVVAMSDDLCWTSGSATLDPWFAGPAEALGGIQAILAHHDYPATFPGDGATD
jgi:hypothetical protein